MKKSSARSSQRRHDVNNLGLVLRDLGDLPAAKAAFERALAIDEKVFGPESSQRRHPRQQPGSRPPGPWRPPRRQSRFERALAIWKSSSARSSQGSHGLNNLGCVLQDLGDLPAAQAAFERALAIDENISAPIIPT